MKQTFKNFKRKNYSSKENHKVPKIFGTLDNQFRFGLTIPYPGYPGLYMTKVLSFHHIIDRVTWPH